HPAAAGRVFEKLEATGKKPDATFYRAGYLARNGRLTEALGLCERLRKDVTPETAARVGLELLDQGDPDEDQLGRVEGWIKEGLRAADKPAARAALQERLATLYNLQGRYQESVDLYRDCLKQNGRDVVAANNLAWMLAVTRRDLDEALALIQRAIDRAGPQLELLDTRAAVYLARGEGGLAVKDLEVVGADRASGPAYCRLAQARHAGKDADAARDALRQALRLGLKEKDLHPLERDQLGRLRAALDVK